MGDGAQSKDWDVSKSKTNSSIRRCIYGQDEHLLPATKIWVTFINRTNTKVHLNVSEELTKRPYTYQFLKEFLLPSGQRASTSLVLTPNDTLKKTLSISTSGGLGYGEKGSSIEIDLCKSKAFSIELVETWVYPGEELWPPVTPFRVIQARL